MQVETFECSETATETAEMCEEARTLMQKFGMTELPKDGERRFPFREMTKEERIVYGTICPTTVSLREYTQSSIPLRVLQCIDLCHQFPDKFTNILIWDRVSAEIKDPIAIAQLGQNSWDSKYYMLARWGEELEPYSVLAKKVRAELAKQMKNRLQAMADMAISACGRVEDMDLQTLSSPPSDYDLRSI